jgi:hypothetical protein
MYTGQVQSEDNSYKLLLVNVKEEAKNGEGDNKEETTYLIKKNKTKVMTHVCNPSYSGGKDGEDQGSGPAQGEKVSNT